MRATGPEIAAALSEASGTPCTYRASPPRIVQRFLLPDLYNMVSWFESDGGNYSADPAKGRALVGATALGPKEWFAAKGQWADGRKFGEPAPPGSASAQGARRDGGNRGRRRGAVREVEVEP